MDFVDIERKVIKWGEDRGILPSADIQSQLIKLEEELDELKDAETKTEFMDAIGDMMVVMTMIASSLDITMTQCYERAYNEIKDRTGTLVSGIFVKDK